MDWTNGQVLNFIRLYEKYAVLWNSKHPAHKNRKLMTQAWLNLRNELGMDLDVADIKRKKESLLATYRTLKRKVLSSQQSGNVADVYKPTWFAYNSLDRFLRDKTSIEDNIEDQTANDDPEEEVYDDYIEITDFQESEPQHFPSRRTGCLRKPYTRGRRDLKAYEELRKKKLQLEVRKLEIEVREKGESGEGSLQLAGDNQALARLRKRKLELEIRKLELDVWEHEEILGVKHSKLTDTIERVSNNDVFHDDVSKQLGNRNPDDNSVLIDHSEVVQIEEYNNGSLNDEISVDNNEREDHNYGSVDVDLSEMLKVNKRL